MLASLAFAIARHPGLRVAIALPILSGGLPAGAQTVLPPYVRASVTVGGLSSGHVVDTGAVNLPTVSANDAVSGTTPAGSSVFASGSASADATWALHIAADADATTVAPDFPNVRGSVGSLAARADTFHVLPAPGQTMSFLETITFSGTSAGVCAGVGDCAANLTFEVSNPIPGSPSGIGTMSAGFYYDSNDPAHPAPLPSSYTQQQVLTFHGPASFSLQASLALDIEVTGDPTASYQADFSHTGHFYLDPLTPGSVYTTDSGLTYYAPAVPEPASSALLLAGLCTLCAAGRARRRRQP